MCSDDCQVQRSTAALVRRGTRIRARYCDEPLQRAKVACRRRATLGRMRVNQ